MCIKARAAGTPHSTIKQDQQAREDVVVEFSCISPTHTCTGPAAISLCIPLPQQPHSADACMGPKPVRRHSKLCIIERRQQPSHRSRPICRILPLLTLLPFGFTKTWSIASYKSLSSSNLPSKKTDNIIVNNENYNRVNSRQRSIP